MKLAISVAALITLLYIGSRPLPAGDATLPPIGSFFSPATGFWQNGNIAPSMALTIPGISSEGDIYLDERGVPHIFASNYLDAVRIQGYLHAQNRLFQMDISSRFVAGRLSEFFGERMFNIDKLMRRRGLPYAAENALKGWKKHPKNMSIVEAYTEGVNIFISNLSPRHYPIEYKLLAVEPELWSTLKTALINKSMTFDLCFRNEDDLATKTLDMMDREMYDFLYPFRHLNEDPIIPVGTKWSLKNSKPLGQVFPFKNNHGKNIEYAPIQAMMPDEAIGSNNWAVAGSKTKSGAPILCNDPHLRLRLPSVWYELQIHVPETNVYGVSLPGAPGIIIGFNEHLAWGVTNSGIDVADWYHIKWKNKTTGEYILDNNILNTDQRIETISIKGQPDFVDTVNYTLWGPITYSDDTSHYLYNHALRWIGHDEQAADELNCFIGLNHAKNLDDYNNATKEFRSPAQNIVCATKQNEIALRISGAFPVRNENNGVFLLDGSNSKNKWMDFVNADENPVVTNPSRGFVSSANQISTDSTYPYPYYGYFADYRGRILNDKLSTMSSITPEDMMALQTNAESPLVGDVLPLLMRASDNDSLSDRARHFISLLSEWDQTFKSNRIEPALFWSWFQQFYKMTWDEFNQPDKKLKTPEFWRTIEMMGTYPSHMYFDIKGTSKIENAHDVATYSLERMAIEMDSMLSRDVNYNWGKYNANKIDHLLSLPAFSSEINAVDGFKYSLNATNATHGPSWRMVVEMGDPIRAWGVYPGGQSGHPGHKNYADMIGTWTTGEYYPINFMTEGTRLTKSNSLSIKCKAE